MRRPPRIVRWALVSTLSGKNHPGGSGKDVKIEPGRPIADVVTVQPDSIPRLTSLRPETCHRPVSPESPGNTREVCAVGRDSLLPRSGEGRPGSSHHAIHSRVEEVRPGWSFSEPAHAGYPRIAAQLSISLPFLAQICVFARAFRNSSSALTFMVRIFQMRNFVGRDRHGDDRRR